MSAPISAPTAPFRRATSRNSSPGRIACRISTSSRARIELDDEGGATVYVGSANVGQGLETVCAQIAAEALGLPIEKIRVLHGSTTLLKEGFGAFHSRSVVMGGSAILDAARKLRETGARSAEGTFAGHKHTYASGAAATHVAVAARTGHGQVLEYLMVEDLGRVINPLT